MAQKLIPWNTGGGNIVVNYSGSGNDTVTVGSDTDNNSSSPRSQVLTIPTTAGGTISRTVTVTQEAHVSPLTVPLTFDILGSGTITWKASDSSLTKTIQYKKNNGSWTSITSSTSGNSISVSIGDTLQFRGSNSAYGSSDYYNFFTATCDFNARGNIMSLISNSFEELTAFSSSYALRDLFHENTHLRNASGLLLPATTLTDYCYYQTFYGCSNLTAVSELPATTLTNSCYRGMYNGCAKLTSAPALPATTLTEACYRYMFYGCTSLTTAPDLPATTLAAQSYFYMFYNCSNLNYIRCLAVDRTASSCTYFWVSGVSASGTFVKNPAASWSSSGTSSIPNGWTVQDDTTPILQYLTFDILGSGTIGWRAQNASLTKTIQYRKNGGNWTSITSTTSGVTISVANGDVVQFKGDNTEYGNASYYNRFTATCQFKVRGNIMSLINSTSFASLTTLTKTGALRTLFYQNTYLIDASELLLPATTLSARCYQGLFNGCTNLTAAPVLPAATLASNAYNNLFKDCSSLTYIKCLATDISASNCTSNWVNGVAASGTFVKASTMSSWTTGNAGIPSGWTVEDATS